MDIGKTPEGYPYFLFPLGGILWIPVDTVAGYSHSFALGREIMDT